MGLTVADVVEKLPENPYPEDIFIPIPKEQLTQIHELLLEKIGIPLDRLSGHVGRHVHKCLIEEISSLKLSPEKVVGMVMQDTDFCMKVWKAIYSSAHEVLGGPSVLANKGIEIADKACKKLGGDTSFIG